MIQFKALEFHICKPERKQFKIFSQKSHKNDYRKKIRHFLLRVSAIVHMWSMQEPAFHCLFCSIYFFDKMTRLQKSIYFIQISVKTNTLECLTVRIIVSLVTHTHFRCSESRKNDLFITLSRNYMHLKQQKIIRMENYLNYGDFYIKFWIILDSSLEIHQKEQIGNT